MWSKQELLIMSLNFAPNMPFIYHLEFVRIAEDILRIKTKK